MPKTMKTFAIGIDTEVSVNAFDEASARKKVAAALRPGRLTSDVKLTVEPDIYEVVPEENGHS